MADDVKVRIIVDSDTKGASEAESGIRKVGDAAEGAASQARKASFDFKEFAKNAGLGATAIVGAFAGAIGFGAKVAGDLESARQGFVALLGSAEKADATVERIKREAAQTPFEITGLTVGAQALAAITKDGDKAVDMLLDVGKAIATSGKGQAELDRVIFNMQQISATGRVTEMDIRQFQSAIPIFNDIVAGIGLTTEELKDSSNAAELLQLAFEKAGQEGGISAQGFTAQAGTFNQLISNMKDNVTIFASEFVKQTGIFDMVKDAIGRFNEVMAPLGQSLIDLFNWMKNNETAMNAVKGAVFALAIAIGIGLWAVMGPVIVATVTWTAVGAALGLAIDGVTKFLQDHIVIAGFLAGFIGTIMIGLIIRQTIAWGQMAVTMLSRVVPAIIATMISMGPLLIIATIVGLAVAGLALAWSKNWGNIRQVTENAVNWIIGKINSLIDKINSFLGVLGKIPKIGGMSFTSGGGEGGGGEGTQNSSSFTPPVNFSPGLPNYGQSIPGNQTLQSITQNNNITGNLDMDQALSSLAFAMKTAQ